jgi:hypothetical protein
VSGGAARTRDWLRDGSGVVLACFAALSVAPLVALLIRAAMRGEHFAGPGAGLAILDQYRYLAWIRDAGAHVLIAPGGGTLPGAHAYLNPVFLISGLLVRGGVSIQLAYQLWLPVAIIVLFAGYRALVWRAVEPGRARGVTLALALIGCSPLLPLLDYGKVVDANGAAEMINVATHLSPYWQAWGYFPTAIALGLIPLWVLELARAPRPRLVRLCAVGATVSLLDPWAGLTLLLLGAFLLARELRTMVVPLLAVAAPLLYYLVLARSNVAWTLGNLRNSFGPGPLWVFPIVLGPLLVPAVVGRQVGRGRIEQALWLWPLASLLALALVPGNAELTALEGTSLPLAVLAVRGWRRLHAPALVSAGAVALMIAPGVAYAGATFHDYVNDHYAPYNLASGELAALRSTPRVRVLTTDYLAPAMVALTGRVPVPVPVPQEGRGRLNAENLFDGHLGAPATRTLLAATGEPRELISDCLPRRADLAALLAPLGYERRRYGCASVYERP